MSFNSVCNHTRDKQIGLPLRSRPILLTDRIGLHSVLLPLLIPGLSRPALKTVLLFIYCFYCIRAQFWLIAFRRKGKGKEKLVSLIYSNPLPFITSITAAVTFLQSLSSPFYINSNFLVIMLVNRLSESSFEFRLKRKIYFS